MAADFIPRTQANAAEVVLFQGRHSNLLDESGQQLATLDQLVGRFPQVNEAIVEFAWGLLHLYLTDAAGVLRECARLTVPPRHDRNQGPTLRKGTLVFNGPCWRPDDSEKGCGWHASYGVVMCTSPVHARERHPLARSPDAPCHY